jgi:hypothetical protein
LFVVCFVSVWLSIHIRKNNNKGRFTQFIIEVESPTMVRRRQVRQTRGMARMEQQRNADVEEIPVVTHETLTPPAVSVFNVISKTSEFKWKLTKLPVNPHAVEVIKFETEVVGDGVTVLYLRVLK